MNNVLMLQEALPYHGGVPRKFLCLARNLPRGGFHFGSLRDTPDSILPRIAAEGAPVAAFGSRNLLIAPLRIRRYIKRHRIAAIFACSFRAYCAAKLASLFLPCQVVTCVCDFSLRRKPLKRALFGLIARRDWLVANSRALLEAHAVPGRPRAVLLYNGIEAPPPPDRTRTRQELGIPPEAQVLLYAADWQPYKDHPTLLAAFRMLAGRWPNLYLALCGREGGLPRQVEDPALLGPPASRRVLLFGPRNDMERFFAAADLYVHPCYDEGFGGGAAEAMLAGVPVVAANCGGLPETVSDGGVLFEPRNPLALAEAVEGLLGDGARRAELAERGRRRATQAFSVEAFTGNFLALCQTILKETPD